MYQIVAETLSPLRSRICNICGIDRSTVGHKIYRITSTFILIDISWIFFRANGFKQALLVIKSIFTTFNPWILFDGSLYTRGLDSKNFILLLLCIIILFFSDYCKYKGVCIRKIILCQNFITRCFIYSFSILFILIFGIWGYGYDAANFIYFQF